MKPTEDQLVDSLRAASARLPAGDAMLLLIVVSEHEGAAIVSSASNMKTRESRVRVLELELQREQKE